MAWLVGSLLENGWLVGPLVSSDGNKQIVISAPNLIVDKNGNPVTHTFDYWFLTQTNPDIQTYNNGTVQVVDKGTNLSIVNGEGLLSVSFALVGSTYKLIAFDANESNYFRLSAIVQDAS